MFARHYLHPEPPMTSRRSFPWCIAAGAALAIVAAAPAAAQTRVELIPFIGSYYALSNTGLADPGDPSKTERHENQPAFGAALLVRVSQTLAFEGTFAYAPSGTNITSDSTTLNRDFAGTVLLAGARARFWLPRTNFYVLAGAGMVSRGGEAWDFANLTELTSIAGVAGFGVQAEVSPTVRMDFKIEVQVYSFDPDGEGTAANYDSKTMPDILATVGIPIKLMGR